MGLFINNDKHKNIYINQDELTNTNQNFFRKDHLFELLKKQEKINHSLRQSILELTKTTRQQNYKQKEQWSEIDYQFNKYNEYYDEKDSQFRQRLLDLETANRKLQKQFYNRKLFEQEQMNQIHSLQIAKNEMVEQLKQYVLRNKQVEKEVNEQFSVHQQINELVKERLEIQEGISAKILNQLENFRSIEMKNQLNQLIELQEKHGSMEQKVLDLNIAKEELQLQINNRKLDEQECFNQMNSLQKTINEITKQLNQYILLNEQTEEKIEEQKTVHNQLNELVLGQTKNQTEFLKRLDYQETVSEKVLRQVGYFRSIIFERTRVKKEDEKLQHLERKELENLSTNEDNHQHREKLSPKDKGCQNARRDQIPLTRKKVLGKKKYDMQKHFSNYPSIEQFQQKDNSQAPRKDDRHDEKQ